MQLLRCGGCIPDDFWCTSWFGRGNRTWVSAWRRASKPPAPLARFHAGHPRDRRLEDDYELQDEILGTGSSGSTRLVTSRIDGRKYALKTYDKKGMTEGQYRHLKKEFEVFLAVDHPNIAQVCDVYEWEDGIALLMEYCSGKELLQRLEAEAVYSEADVAKATVQIILAVKYLHAHNIVHGDLNLFSFLYESAEKDAHLKLRDIGLCETLEDAIMKMKACTSTMPFRSPEVISSKECTSQSDLWSVGVVVFMLLAGRPPWSTLRGLDGMRRDIAKGLVQWDLLQNASNHARDFVQKLLVTDPMQRMTADAALEHIWIINGRQELSSPTIRITVRHCGSGEEICKVWVKLDDPVSKVLATALEAADRKNGCLLLESEALNAEATVEDAGVRDEVFLVVVTEDDVDSKVDGFWEQKQQLEHSLSFKQRHLGANHPEVVSTLKKLGDVLEKMNDFRQMAEVLQRCVNIEEEQHGYEHPEMPATLFKLGVAYGKLGDHRRRVHLLEDCANLQEQRLWEDDSRKSDLAETLLELGMGYGFLGEHEKQAKLLERGLQMVESHHGTDHPKAIPFLRELGSVYGGSGEDGKAKSFLERCESIEKRGRDTSRAECEISPPTKTAVTHDQVDGLLVTLGQHDFAQIRHGVVMVSRRHSRARFEITGLEECPKLPANVCPLSPVLKLLPHETRFDEEPVLLIIRVCMGAQAVWRSSSDGGWESLPDAKFYPGHAVLWLDHFCELFVGTDGTCAPKPRGVLVRGFMDGTTGRGKCAVLHANCPSCTQQLEPMSDYRVDPNVLRGFDECGPAFCAGSYSHGDRLTIAQDQHDHQDIALNFNRLPLVTSRCFQAQQTQFEVEIADTVHAFRLHEEFSTVLSKVASPAAPPPPPTTTPRTEDCSITPSPPPPPLPPLYGQEVGNAAGLHLILPWQSDVEVYTAEEPHTFLSTGELEAGRLHIAELLQQAHADSGENAGLLLQVVPPPPPPPPPPDEEHQPDPPTQAPPPPPAGPQSSQRRNLMISGRFNDQQKMNYMRQVNDMLRDRSVPVDMVRANFAGATFGDQTARLLYKAKALLPFCTWDYGEKTGAQYETYIELQYAHQNKLAILPIQLCHDFPPCPKDEEGRALNALVFRSDLVRIIDKDMSDPERVAAEICDAWFTAIQHM
ncbi:cmk-1 [Symbiodinium sp. CCMP2592]|nr:cmk-1 [Symbiodinium sp. CCMP2592]